MLLQMLVAIKLIFLYFVSDDPIKSPGTLQIEIFMD